jgi:hypothetical protein
MLMFVSAVIVSVGVALVLGAKKLEACSVRLWRRSPHLFPLRAGRSFEARAFVARMNVVLFRSFGALFVLVGLAVLIFGDSR